MRCFTALISSWVVVSAVVAAPPPGGCQATSSGPVRLPTRMDFGKPAVEVIVNGKGPWLFFADTGAGVTVIDKSLAKELGLEVTGKRPIGGPSDPEGIDADVVRIDSLKLGSIELTNVEAASWDRSELYKQAGRDRPRGVLGLGLFAGYLLTFDGPGRQVIIEDGALPERDDKHVVPFKISEYGIPVIQIAINGRSIDAHFDTGSPGSLTLPDSMEKNLKFKTKPRVMGRARTVNGAFEIRGAQLDGNVDIMGYPFDDPQVALISALDGMHAAVIGSRLLRDFVLTFDQKNKRVRLQKP